MYDEGVTYLIPCYSSILLGGRGFLCNMQKEIFILLFTYDNSILILNEIEFGVSDLGRRIRHIIIE